MKKIIPILLALLLILSMAIPAAAATPTLQIPKVPQISNIKISVQLDERVYENAVDKWLAEHPFKFNPRLKIPNVGD